MKHTWNGGDKCVRCGLNREGWCDGPYGAMRYYVDDGQTYSYKPGPCRAANPEAQKKEPACASR